MPCWTGAPAWRSWSPSFVMTATATTAVAANAAGIGPDVSSHNHSGGGSVIWASVHGVGRSSFAFVKANERLRYRNPYFASDFAAIHARGMVRGAYDFARPAGGTHQAVVASATAEANFFVRTAGTLRRKSDLPPALDIEAAGTLNAAQLSVWTHTWLARAQKLDRADADHLYVPILLASQDGELEGFRQVPPVARVLLTHPAHDDRRLEQIHVLAVRLHGETGRGESVSGYERVQRDPGSAQSDGRLTSRNRSCGEPPSRVARRPSSRLNQQGPERVGSR